MVADSALPVWSIRPNWKDGILERLGWLTDVLPSSYGPEQRRALRISPRRGFEINFNHVDGVRSYFELWLHRLGSQEFMLPLFHDRGKLSAGVAIGATDIPFDTTNREFAVDELAIILGDDPWTWDKVTISAITDAGITAGVGEVTRAWPKGSAIYPLRRSRMSQESASSALTSHVGEATLEFTLNQANEIADEGAWETLFGEYPIMLDKPNWRESRDLSFLRNSLLVDNELGLSYLGDDANRAFTVDTHSRMIRGRAEHKAFRQFLYRLRGQQGAIWVPTFNRDIELTQPALAADTKLDVRKIGYAYTGGVTSGRKYLLVSDGTIREISGTGAAPSAAEERLNLAAAVGGAGLPVGAYGSFIDTCRLTQDDIEITHHTDTDGVAECNLSFRSFRDERVPPTILESLIPVATEAQTYCGTPAVEEASCVDLESGFFAKMIFDYTLGAHIPISNGGMNITIYRTGFGEVEYISSYSGDGTWTVQGDGGQVFGCTCVMTSGVDHIGTVDPFSTPGTYTMDMQHQFGYGAFGCGGGPSVGCGGLARAYFKQPNGAVQLMSVIAGTTPDGYSFEIERLWPRYYTFQWEIT